MDVMILDNIAALYFPFCEVELIFVDQVITHVAHARQIFLASLNRHLLLVFTSTFKGHTFLFLGIRCFSAVQLFLFCTSWQLVDLAYQLSTLCGFFGLIRLSIINHICSRSFSFFQETQLIILVMHTRLCSIRCK